MDSCQVYMLIVVNKPISTVSISNINATNDNVVIVIKH